MPNHVPTEAKMMPLEGRTPVRVCPFAFENFSACFCGSKDYRQVSSMIHYCGGNFLNCAVYKDLAPKVLLQNLEVTA